MRSHLSEKGKKKVSRSFSYRFENKTQNSIFWQWTLIHNHCASEYVKQTLLNVYFSISIKSLHFRKRKYIEN